MKMSISLVDYYESAINKNFINSMKPNESSPDSISKIKLWLKNLKESLLRDSYWKSVIENIRQQMEQEFNSGLKVTNKAILLKYNYLSGETNKMWPLPDGLTFQTFYNLVDDSNNAELFERKIISPGHILDRCLLNLEASHGSIYVNLNFSEPTSCCLI